MNIFVHPAPDDAAKEVARLIAERIRESQQEGRPYVLGLATGSTPKPLYKELVRMHREEGLSFANVTTFNLDEYYGLTPDNDQSYHHFMHAQLFNHVDVPPANVNIPSGTVPEADVAEHCARYEAAIAAAGGIDLQILGIGRNGHIGFNESPSPADSLTRMVELHPFTRADAAGDFGALESVPTRAITMGVRTIMEAREVVLMAWGEGKSPTVAAAFQGPVAEEVPASFLQGHPSAAVFLDVGAAQGMSKVPVTRVSCHWALTRGRGRSTASGSGAAAGGSSSSSSTSGIHPSQLWGTPLAPRRTSHSEQTQQRQPVRAPAMQHRQQQQQQWRGLPHGFAGGAPRCGSRIGSGATQLRCWR